VNLCKDLVNAPPNVVTPAALADSAMAIAAAHPNMRCEVLLEPDIAARGMGAFLGVAQGSKPGEGSPRFIHLSYAPAGGVARKRVALVGKGLTFDSGGYNLKTGPGSMMELMKFDMGGAAAVLGAAEAIGLLQPPGVAVDFIVAACENMVRHGPASPGCLCAALAKSLALVRNLLSVLFCPFLSLPFDSQLSIYLSVSRPQPWHQVSDRAMRPGDILTASNGLTIEVLNTDAEGRLTLADALVFAEKLKPTSIVDVATLTGACIVRTATWKRGFSIPWPLQVALPFPAVLPLHPPR
jgi:leucyl aminopeptidase